jgi:diguanylate cyclase (GGDEF)-like protein
MSDTGRAASRRLSLQAERSLALIFAMLGAVLVGLTALHWFLVLEPTLRTDAQSHSRVLAQAQASGIEQRIGSGRPESLRAELETALDALVLVKDQVTGQPFIPRITLVMDYEHFHAAAGSLDMARGVEACAACFATAVPLYRPRDRQLVGIATFYTSPQALHAMTADFRGKLLWGGGSMLCLIGIAWVGTGRLLRRLAETEANLCSLFEAATFPMVLHKDGAPGLSRANQAAKDYLCLREDATGRHVSNAWRALEAAGLPTDAGEHREFRIETPEGGERWALVSAIPVQTSEGPSRLVSLVDVSELKAIQSELLVASLTDSLTGLYNRRYLFLKLAEEIERTRRFTYRFSIVLFDLDHFKRVNDTFGHRVGDEVLTRVAAALRATIRDLDMAGRYGGEEFLVILPYADDAEALDVAERIRSRIKAIAWPESGLRVTMSGGVCEYAGTDIDAFVDHADRKLYEAKTAGRDRVIR